MGRRALVTGATGGLGRHVVNRLAEAGYSVIANGRDQRAGAAIADAGHTFIGGDLRNEADIDTLTRDVDTIFHCAALSSPWGKAADFQAINVEVTQKLLEAALTNGVKNFIHVSTPSLYFDYRDRENLRENDNLARRFVNHYASSKAEAERRVLNAGNGHLNTSAIRPRAIFGEYDSVLLPRLLRVAQGGTMPMFSNGAAMVDVTYAGNVADAMLLCDTNAEQVNGRVFNITNGEPMRIRTLMEKVFSALQMDVRLRPVPYRVVDTVAGIWEAASKALALKSEPKILRYSAGVMNYSQTLDISSARQVLGYQPRVSVDEGLARFATWYKASK